VIGRTAVRPSAQEAQHDDSSDSGSFGRFDDCPSAVDVHFLVGLFPEFSIDACTVSDDIAALERFGESVNIIDVDSRAARERGDIRRIEAVGQMATDEASPTGDRDLHLPVPLKSEYISRS
jgi:hypothetical protein